MTDGAPRLCPARVRFEDNQGDRHARVWHPAEQPGTEDDMRAWPAQWSATVSHTKSPAGASGRGGPGNGGSGVRGLP